MSKNPPDATRRSGAPRGAAKWKNTSAGEKGLLCKREVLKRQVRLGKKLTAEMLKS